MRWPDMTIFSGIIAVFWVVFLAFWAVMAMGAKKNVGPRAWRREGGFRVGLLVLVLLALRLPAARHAMRSLRSFGPGAEMILGIVGVVLCALGIGLAIWARVSLGRNWGMPMSRKAAPELVTGGPYAYARHPIYGGVIIAMLGSMIGESVAWMILLIIVGAYFLYSARSEEALMTAQFPEQYPAYKRRTKMLVPFVL